MTRVEHPPASDSHYKFFGSEMSLSSSAEQRFKTKPKRTRGARLQSRHINTLADNLDPPCVTAAFEHASMDQNTGQLLHATLNQVKCHISSFLWEHTSLPI